MRKERNLSGVQALFDYGRKVLWRKEQPREAQGLDDRKAVRWERVKPGIKKQTWRVCRVRGAVPRGAGLHFEDQRVAVIILQEDEITEKGKISEHQQR